MQDRPSTAREVAGPLWWGAAAGVAALCAASAALSGTEAGTAVYAVAVLVLALSFGVVVVRRDLRPRAAWCTFAAGIALLALGDAVFDVPAPTDGVAGTGLVWADPLYLLGSLVLVVGAMRLKDASAGGRDHAALIDAASIGLATGVMLWNPLIEPRLSSDGTGLVERLVSGSYPVLDIVVLAMLVWLLLGERRLTPATGLLVAGAAAYLVADLAYTVRVGDGTAEDPSLVWWDTFWLLGIGLYLLAALHPSAGVLGRRSPNAAEHTLTRARLALSGLALLAPIVALGLSDSELHHLVLAVGVEAVLVLLVMVRLSTLAAGERRARAALVDRERYFRSLVQHASEAMVVLDADGVVLDASPAVRTLLGVRPTELLGSRLARAVPGLDRGLVDSVVATSVASPDVVITNEVPVADAGTTRWLEMRVTNLLADRAVAGLVVNLHDVTARRQVQVDLERRAFSDPLTGLPNRALFHDRLEQLLDRRDPPDLAILYCDLDHFKAVNDRYGHAEGDQVLATTARRLADAVRAEDTVARFGGDEFVVLVHGPDAFEVADEIAERVVGALRLPVVVEGDTLPMAASVGVACARAGTGEGARSLMHRADEAMYRAKRAGGDRVVSMCAGVETVGQLRLPTLSDGGPPVDGSADDGSADDGTAADAARVDCDPGVGDAAPTG